jgi:hypothetical protein
MKLVAAISTVSVVIALVCASVATARVDAPRTAHVQSVLQSMRAFHRVRTHNDAIPSALASTLSSRIDLASSRRVLTTGDGTSLFVTKSQDSNLLCLVAVTGGAFGFGCTTADQFFADRGFNILVREEGGVVPTAMTVMGVVSSDTARVTAVSGALSIASVTPNANGGFVMSLSGGGIHAVLSGESVAGHPLKAFSLPN